MPSSSPRAALLSALSVGLLWSHALFPRVSATVVDELQQGFYFDWSGDQSPPVPTAAQCETLHITWARRDASGPNPVAPYFLQVFTSAFIVPFIIPAGDGQSFDWPVPFIPDTQFQICMYASNGVTGGCQQIYTVYQAPNTTLNDPPVCTNLTYPSGALDVTAKFSDGTWSQYGWVDQCSDITFTPNNGTAPYSYTIAPALRPPFNFTSDTKDTVDWTVTLAFGLPFWVTVADSTGFSWTNGPLHASPGSSASCLSPQITEDDGLSTGSAIGIAFGSLVAGLLAGLAGAWFFFRSREKRYGPVGGLPLLRKSSEPQSPLSSGSALGFASQPPSSSASGSFAHAFPHHHRLSPSHIEPFILPSAATPEDPQQQQQQQQYQNGGTRTPHSATFSSSFSALQRPLTGDSRDAPTPTPASPLYGHNHSPSTASIGATAGTGAPSPSGATGSPSGAGGGGGGRGSSGGGGAHVYVVHHDGGRPPPVTVFTSDGTEVVELPPHYEPPADARDARERGLVPAPVQPPPPGGVQPRQPRGLVAKAPRVTSHHSAS